MPFLTPMATAPGYTVRALSIPDNPYWVALTAGALLEMCNPANWEMSPGGITPYEAAEIAVEIFLSLATEVPPNVFQFAWALGNANTIPHNTPTTIVYAIGGSGNAFFDPLLPDRATIEETGYYHVSASIAWAFSATGFRILRLVVNSDFNIYAQSNVMPVTIPNHLTTQYVSFRAFLTAGSFVKAQAFQTSGGNLTIQGTTAGPFYNQMAVERIG